MKYASIISLACVLFVSTFYISISSHSSDNPISANSKGPISLRCEQATIQSTDNSINGSISYWTPAELSTFLSIDDWLSFYNSKATIIDPITGTEFELTADQKTALINLPGSFVGVSVSITNGSDSPITLQQNAYIKELAPYIITKNNVLNAYPIATQVKNAQQKTMYYFIGGASLEVLAIIFGVLKYLMKDRKGIKQQYNLLGSIINALLIAGIVGSSLSGALSLALGTWRTKAIPPKSSFGEQTVDVASQYDLLEEQINKVLISDPKGENYTSLQGAPTYVIPPGGTFSEVLFVDAQSFASAQIGNNVTLNYSVNQ